MITATFFRQADQLTGFTITGHAGYAEKGQDIVCAAVSVLSTAIANGLTEVLHLTVALTVDDETGYMNVCLPEDAPENAQILLKTLELGLTEIEENYPGYLRVT